MVKQLVIVVLSLVASTASAQCKLTKECGPGQVCVGEECVNFQETCGVSATRLRLVAIELLDSHTDSERRAKLLVEVGDLSEKICMLEGVGGEDTGREFSCNTKKVPRIATVGDDKACSKFMDTMDMLLNKVQQSFTHGWRSQAEFEELTRKMKIAHHTVDDLRVKTCQLVILGAHCGK